MPSQPTRTCLCRGMPEPAIPSRTDAGRTTRNISGTNHHSLVRRPIAVYMALPSAPLCSDLEDTILQWDTDHMYFQAEACPGTDRLTQASAFLELNHITSVHVSSLDDEIDSSSAAYFAVISGLKPDAVRGQRDYAPGCRGTWREAHQVIVCPPDRSRSGFGVRKDAGRIPSRIIARNLLRAAGEWSPHGSTWRRQHICGRTSHCFWTNYLTGCARQRRA